MSSSARHSSLCNGFLPGLTFDLFYLQTEFLFQEHVRAFRTDPGLQYLHDPSMLLQMVPLPDPAKDPVLIQGYLQCFIDL